MMHTLKLKIDDKVYDQLIGLLGRFTKDEVEIIMEENEVQETKKYLQEELDNMISGKATYLSVNETEQRLETLIRKYEDRI
jgi:uncharacterized protein involved in exopolysaccharide biosynthesis